MKREYTSGTSDGVKYFIGVEIEHIPSYGLKTLFIATPEIDLHHIRSLLDKQVEAVYFGANHVFRTSEVDSQSIFRFASEYPNMKIVLDIPSDKWNKRLSDLEEIPDNITVIVSCEVRKSSAKNVFVKIDDSGFRETNPGVWIVDPNNNTIKFNDWENYGNDTIISA